MERLSDHDRSLLRIKQNYERNKQRYIKITAILMRDRGYTATEIAETLGVVPSTIHRYIARFSECTSVEEYLKVEYRGRPWGLSAAQLMQLCDAVNDQLFRSAGAVADYIEKSFGIRYTRRHVRRLLGDLGFSFKKTTSLPSGADPQKQQKFLKTVLRPLLRRTEKTGELVYFADAAHPEHNTRQGYGWIAKAHNFTGQDDQWSATGQSQCRCQRS